MEELEDNTEKALSETASGSAGSNALPDVLSPSEQAALEKITGKSWGKYTRVAMAALSSLPWVGSLIGAAAALSGENSQEEINKIMLIWVQGHEEKLKEFASALGEIFSRFESFGERIDERIKSEEYLSLVRKTFRQWDYTETFEKKEMHCTPAMSTKYFSVRCV